MKSMTGKIATRIVMFAKNRIVRKRQSAIVRLQRRLLVRQGYFCSIDIVPWLINLEKQIRTIDLKERKRRASSEELLE